MGKQIVLIGPDEEEAILALRKQAEAHPFSDEELDAMTIEEQSQFQIVIPEKVYLWFTIRKKDGKLWRHLAVSVPEKGTRLNDGPLTSIAKRFGFSKKRQLEAAFPAEAEGNPGFYWFNLVQLIK